MRAALPSAMVPVWIAARKVGQVASAGTTALQLCSLTLGGSCPQQTPVLIWPSVSTTGDEPLLGHVERAHGLLSRVAVHQATLTNRSDGGYPATEELSSHLAFPLHLFRTVFMTGLSSGQIWAGKQVYGVQGDSGVSECLGRTGLAVAGDVVLVQRPKA